MRKWKEAAKLNIQAVKAEQAKACLDARNEVADFRPGVRCDVGKVVIVTKVSAGLRQVWAHDDKPVTYKINRNWLDSLRVLR